MNGVELAIIKEPVDKLKFRYKYEKHGSLIECQTEGSAKTYPTVELRGYNGQAFIRYSLFQVSSDSPHCHYLVREKEDNLDYGPHISQVSQEKGYRAT